MADDKQGEAPASASLPPPTPPTPAEFERQIVRVVRVLEYIGPRNWAESTIAKSHIKGARAVGPNRVISEIAVGAPILAEMKNE